MLKFCVLVFVVVDTVCGASLKRYEYSEAAMGVRARIVLYAADEKHAKEAAESAFKRIAFLEDVMSDYRPTSELMRLCSKAGGPAVPVSKELLFVLKKAEDFSRLSDGAFDVTVGPLVRLWREARRSGVLPSETDLLAARMLVGWRKLHIDRRAGTVRLELPGMLLDLGGLGKGYACDEALRILKTKGITRVLIEMGGDVVLGDPPPGAIGWEVEFPMPGSTTCKRRLANVGVSSSGDTEQYVEIGGVRYSHIVDPRTGLGLTHRMAVTVIARDGITSDALSTAVSVLGPVEGQAFIRKFAGALAYIRPAE